MSSWKSFLLIASIALHTGCLRLIDVDVPADAGEWVIEAYYNDQDSAVVKLTQTIPYFKEGRPPFISEAIVTLEEVETGAVDTLQWRDTVYVRVGGRVVPRVGHTYTLRVRIGEENIYATTRMPRAVGVDTLFVLWRPASGVLPEGYRAIAVAQDPPSEQNAYRARVWRNDTLFNRAIDWIYSDDRYIDGRPIVFEFPYELRVGDSLTLEIMTIPVEVARYYDQVLRNAFGGSGGFSPPPDNAYSNFAGGKRRTWGYFICYGARRKGVRVTQ
ncbi:MAG: DUF4249 domain-containing protein [Bacteroidia bacterium]|nr:DUF4249 domain-containing protein [Bacteroidia bacterium]MCX7652552.1 DUF4249 domain-containing protein [Bacteroidia bacterium]MDW8417572.1 DUF4249 domain-containing protein [Bacteroidia bacterium]